MAIEQCNGCLYQRTEEQAKKVLALSLCRVYMYPERQHTRVGGCPMRTHNLTEIIRDDKKVNPLKASKRSQQER